MCEYGKEPPGSTKKGGGNLTSRGPVSFSERTPLHEVSYVYLYFILFYTIYTV